MKFIELFAGIGGFRVGLEACNHRHKAGRQTEGLRKRKSDTVKHPAQRTFTCVYANEWNKYVASIYRRHYGEIDTRDIRDVSTDEIPDHDLLTAGFPCQSFSVAGKRGGFDDTRGTLFFEIARILRDKRPRHFLLENVKGLLSHESGKTFHTILRVLADLGYRVEWMALNSKHFGVPQNRERVFIIGHLRDECGRKVFPIRGSGGKNLDELVSGSIAQRIYSTEGVSKTLASEAGGQGAKTGLYAMRGRNPDDPSDSRTGAPTEQRLEKNSQGTTNTISTVQKDNLWHTGQRIRKLTPVECERLQAFPSGWTEFGINEKCERISDTQRYKALGNAVTTSVIAAIGRALC